MVALAPLSSVNAAVYTLKDCAVDWPGYTTATPDDDPFGVPIFTPTNSGSVAVNGGQLDALSFHYSNSSKASTNNLWKYLKPGDVFIDGDGDGAWNYVVRTPFFDNANYLQAGAGPLYDSSLAWEVLDVSGVDLRYDDQTDLSRYQLGNDTTTATGQAWSGIATTRQGHPWAVTNQFVNSPGVVHLGFVNTADAWDNLTSPINSTGTIAWNSAQLAALDLDIGDTFVVSFTVNCTNDVMFAHVPEPGSLAIWGLGLCLAGVVGYRRRRAIG
jgi:hypothetical protein